MAVEGAISPRFRRLKRRGRKLLPMQAKNPNSEGGRPVGVSGDRRGDRT